MARELDIEDQDINLIITEYPDNVGQQAMVMLRWIQNNGYFPVVFYPTTENSVPPNIFIMNFKKGDYVFFPFYDAYYRQGSVRIELPAGAGNMNNNKTQ